MSTKYANGFKKIRQAMVREKLSPPDLREKNFDLEKHFKKGFLGRFLSPIVSWLINHIFLRFLLMRGKPFRLKFVWIAKFDQVTKALSDPQEFRVPFGIEMTEMSGGRNFALGDDEEVHRRQNEVMAELLPAHLKPDALIEDVALIGNAILEDSGGELNVIRDYLTRVTSEVCLRSFGLEGVSADKFAEYSMAGSALLFADPDGDPVKRQQAMIAAKRLRDILSLNADRLSRESLRSADCLLKGAIKIADADPERVAGEGATPAIARAEVTAIMFGLITGFVPTNALASAKILEEVLKRPSIFQQAKFLAKKFQSADDEDAKSQSRIKLQHILMEAARFNPALAPGQFRVYSQQPYFDHKNSSSGFKFRDGETVLVSTAAALMDPVFFKNPSTFDPERFAAIDAPSNLLFGYGSHRCIGDYIAKEIITELFLLLFALPELKLAKFNSRMRYVGPLPWQLDMKFSVERGHLKQTMVTSTIPLKEGADVEVAKDLLRNWRKNQTLSDGLDGTGVAHFASLNIVNLGQKIAPEYHFLLSLEVDGDGKSGVDRLFKAIGSDLDQLDPYVGASNPTYWHRFLKRFWKRTNDESSAAPRSRVHQIVLDNIVNFKTRPWGAIGLNFLGTEEFSVRQISEEQDLYDFVREHLPRLQRESARSVTNESEMLIREVRKAMIGSKFEHLLYRPSARGAMFTRTRFTSFYSFIGRYFLAPKRTVAFAIFFLTTNVLPLVLIVAGLWHLVVTTYVSLWAVPILLLLSGLLVFAALLRRYETKLEEPDDRFGNPKEIREVLAVEDLPGYAQNHLTSVSDLKPGVFRVFTTALSLYIIKQMTIFWFKPGFVTDFSTIHYAKWFRLAGTKKLIFQSNFDGSWESYLEDFITKVHGGQTIAWNNAVGFPRTNWFFLDGAQVGDQFKRWVRRQQIPNLFWYSRFKELTTSQIRINSLVRDGLARAQTASEYRAWAKLFGSAPRGKSTIESDQVQTLLFRGLGRHHHCKMHLVRFTTHKNEGSQKWLQRLSQEGVNCEKPQIDAKIPKGITFGDNYPDYPCRFVGFTAEGLRYLGVEEVENDTGLASFPISFQEGMARRTNVLGDENCSETDWEWNDYSADEDSAGKKTCHAVIFHYGRTADELRFLDFCLANESIEMDIQILRSIDLNINSGRNNTEPFGFRDGVSQPVMSGTMAFARGDVPNDDVVGPGEFIIGYPDSRGHFPISPLVSADTVSSGCLPSPPEALLDGEVQFAHSDLTSVRDLGRNGSFLVIRQLQQNKIAFDQFLEKNTDPSRNEALEYHVGLSRRRIFGTPDLPGAGESLTLDFKDFQHSPNAGYHLFQDSAAEVKAFAKLKPELERRQQETYLAAKMVGRWQDGSSLVRNPVESASNRQTARIYNAALRQLDKKIRSTFVKLPGSFASKSATKGNSREAKRVKHAINLMGYRMSFAEPMTLNDEPLANQMFQFASSHKIKPKHLYGKMRLRQGIAIWEPDGKRLLKRILRELANDGLEIELPEGMRQQIQPDNDFRHGIDDPQGFHCPIGSHIRRANPRDSFKPGSAVQIAINNRHRLLRRGRSYAKDQEVIGTMFMCFNANIERQFEFVQQTWINSRGFHGMRNQPDPLVTPKMEGDEFIIQSSARDQSLSLSAPQDGQIANFVEMKGGGYFFTPGSQALEFLSQLRPTCPT